MSDFQKRGRKIDNVSMFMFRTFDWNFLMPSSICEFNCTQHYKVQILFKNVLSFFTFSGRFVTQNYIVPLSKQKFSWDHIKPYDYLK